METICIKLSREDSIKVQEILFEHGICWVGHNTNIHFAPEEQYIIINMFPTLKWANKNWIPPTGYIGCKNLIELSDWIFKVHEIKIDFSKYKYNEFELIKKLALEIRRKNVKSRCSNAT